IDLIAKSITAPESVSKGSKVNVKAVVQNQGKEAQNNVLVRFYAGSTTVYETRTNFNANQSKEIAFVYSADKAGSVNLRVLVDPKKEAQDGNRTNNSKETTMAVTTTPPP